MSHERLNSFDKTDSEYSLVSTDDLIKYVVAKVFTSTLGCWSPSFSLFSICINSLCYFE